MMDHWGRVVLAAAFVGAAAILVPILFLAWLPWGPVLMLLWGFLVALSVLSAFVYVVTRGI